MNRPIKIVITIVGLVFILAGVFWYLNRKPLIVEDNSLPEIPKETVVKKDCQVFLAPPKAEEGDEIDLPLECEFDIGKDIRVWKFSLSDEENALKIVVKNENATLIQTIIVDNDIPLSEEAIFGDAYFNIAHDINFDGYKDLRVLSSTGASAVFFDYYNFDPKLGVFKKDNTLVDIPFAQFNSERKVVDGFAPQGANSYMIVTYEFRDGKYFKVKEEDVAN